MCCRAFGSALLSVAFFGSPVYADRQDPEQWSFTLRGDLAVGGIDAPVTIERDERSVALISGASLAEVAFGLGFAHGDDRRFQMELYRRLVYGRLSEMFGPATAPMDAYMRRHGFERVAAEVLDRTPPRHRVLLERYAAGVNACLDAGGVRSLEWGLLGATPGRWEPVDSVACVLFMFVSLSSDFEEELIRQAIEAALPDELVSFILPRRSRFDAPMVGPVGVAGEVPTVPGPGVIDFRDGRVFGPPASGWWPIADVPLEDTFGMFPGSNAWAVAGRRTAHGGAILANDMHLPLAMPGVWYHAQLEWGGGGWPGARDDAAGRVGLPRCSQMAGQLVGLTLPGIPAVLAGSNGRVAFGMTNLIGDVQDRVVIEVNEDNPRQYRVPEGWDDFEGRVELIEVRGGDEWRVVVEETRWGPVLGRDSAGRPFAMRWTAMNPESIGFGAMDLMLASDVGDAARLAASSNGPPLNVVLADSSGRVGWSVSGWIPERAGFDGSVPVSWADGAGWVGRIAGEDLPRLLDPESGAVFNANNRSGSLEQMAPIGRVFASPVRAWRIGQMLGQDRVFDEASVHAMQLDVVDPLRPFYRDAVLAAFEGVRVRDPDVRRAIELARDWDGTAGRAQRGYGVLRRFHHRLQRELIGELIEPVLRVDPTFRVWPPRDEALRRMIEDRPDHLLPPGETGWDSYLRGVFVRAVRELQRSEQAELGSSWGRSNRLSMRHPLSAGVTAGVGDWARPLVGWLDMPAVPQSGDVSTVRVARPGYGVSCRLVVSPGREHLGILVLPGGQSGNPLSPHYRDRQDAWVNGGTEPLLAGEPVQTLWLQPLSLP